MNNGSVGNLRQRVVRRPQLIDSVRRPVRPTLPIREAPQVAAPQPPMPRPQLSAAAASAQILTPNISRMTFEPPVVKKQHRGWQRLQLPLLVTLGLVGGVLAQNMLLGCLLAAAYGIVALFKRIPSRTTFALATMGLAVVCVMLLIKPNGELITNFSTYAFIFLIIGVVSLTRESRLPRSPKRKRR
ncbi:MAG TPA: hypothetical protein VLI54_00360 [Bacillota bacterium]|nr:hypothetical protein [Bacillota bacterium]